jgi:hypothetical protein
MSVSGMVNIDVGGLVMRRPGTNCLSDLCAFGAAVAPAPGLPFVYDSAVADRNSAAAANSTLRKVRRV